MRRLLSIILLILTVTIGNAQNCNKYYQDGIAKQKVMTIASQDAAIQAFTKAKMCYDSKQDKKKCDQQIWQCQQNKKTIIGGGGKEDNKDTAGDKDYRNGVNKQKTQTIEAQNEAIKLFEAAKGKYTTDQNKDKCDKQIKNCQNTIDRINEQEGDKYYAQGEEKMSLMTEEAQDEAIVLFNQAKNLYKVDSQKRQLCDQQIAKCQESLNQLTLVADIHVTIDNKHMDVVSVGKSGRKLSIGVTCNIKNKKGEIMESQGTWEVSNIPSWIVVTKLNKPYGMEIDVTRNKTRQQRTAEIYIYAKGTKERKTIIIRQKK